MAGVRRLGGGEGTRVVAWRRGQHALISEPLLGRRRRAPREGVMGPALGLAASLRVHHGQVSGVLIDRHKRPDNAPPAVHLLTLSCAIVITAHPHESCCVHRPSHVVLG